MLKLITRMSKLLQYCLSYLSILYYNYNNIIININIIINSFNYIIADSLTKLFSDLHLTKFSDTSTKLFFPCNYIYVEIFSKYPFFDHGIFSWTRNLDVTPSVRPIFKSAKYSRSSICF